MENLTPSRQSTRRRCDRLYWFSYVEQLEPVTIEGPRKFGKLFHDALELWWIAARDGSVIDALKNATDSIQDADEDQYEIAKAHALMIGYHLRWKDTIKRWFHLGDLEVVGVEEEFRVPLTSRRQLAGKIDVVVRNVETDEILIVEHKTSSEDITRGSPYWKKLRLNTQISEYLVGASELYVEPIRGCIYDVIAKINKRPYKATPEESRKYTKTGELYANQRAEDEPPAEFLTRVAEDISRTPNESFVRSIIRRSEEELTSFLVHAEAEAAAIEWNEIREFWPQNPDGCFKFGSYCDFFGVCTGDYGSNDPNLFKKKDQPDSELDPNFQMRTKK